MNRTTPGVPVHHQLLEFTQTHVIKVTNTLWPGGSTSRNLSKRFNKNTNYRLRILAAALLEIEKQIKAKKQPTKLS